MATIIYDALHEEYEKAGSTHGKHSVGPSELVGNEDEFNPWDTQTTQRIHVADISDVVTARQQGRELAVRNGSSEMEATLVATVISELSRNMVLYAQGGTISLSTTNGTQGTGVVIGAKDNGPGIPNIDRVMLGGYSTAGGLGLGLSGVRRIADEFLVDTKAGKGTKISVTKWLQ
ncbi:MAG: ATP-binding protein [Gammaproteobacteria bacterium]